MRFIARRRGLLLVVSAPSGGGKSAALRELLARDEGIGYSVSYTSRAPRGSEIDGREYHFVSPARFREMIDEGAFYEWAEVHGNLYGTATRVVDEALDACRDIAMDIDVQGGLNVKARLPDAVLVFLMPPSVEILEQRLRGRASDAEEQIRVRMTNAMREMECRPRYDYVLVNEVLDDTVKALEEILHAERRRVGRTTVDQG